MTDLDKLRAFAQKGAAVTRRDRTVIFRVSGAEYAELQARAGAAGQSLSVWLREQVLRGDRIAELERRIEALERQRPALTYRSHTA